MRSPVVVALLLALAAVASARLYNETITAADSSANDKIWRAYSINVLPGTLIAKGARVQRTGASFKADATLFGITINRKTAFGISYFDATGTADGFNASALGSLDFTSARFAHAVRFLYLVEYAETNGIPGLQYDPVNTTGNDQVVGLKSLTPSQINGLDIFQSPVKGSLNITDNTGNTLTVYYLDLCTNDDVFCIRFYVSGKPVRVDGHLLGPDRLKMTYSIDWFNPSNTLASARNDTKLALVGVHASAGSRTYRNVSVAVAPDGDNTGDGVDVAGDSAVSGYFRWDGNHTINNLRGDNSFTNGSVHTQWVTNYNNATITGGFNAAWSVSGFIWSFGVNTPGDFRTKRIEWDPDSGSTINTAVTDPSSTPSTPSTPSAPGVPASASVAQPLFAAVVALLVAIAALL